MHKRTALLIMIPAIHLGGCDGGTSRIGRIEALGNDPAYTLLADLDVPDVRGIPGAGAQALAAVMAYYDRELNPSDVAEALPWHEFVAEEPALIEWARRSGFRASPIEGGLDDVRRAIARGDPVIVRMHEPVAWAMSGERPATPTGHAWAVVAGLSRDGGTAVLARRGGRSRLVERQQFERLWDACGRRMITLTPWYRDSRPDP